MVNIYSCLLTVLMFAARYMNRWSLVSGAAGVHRLAVVYSLFGGDTRYSTPWCRVYPAGPAHTCLVALLTDGPPAQVIVHRGKEPYCGKGKLVNYREKACYSQWTGSCIATQGFYE